ncbi:MAG TPA: D-alanyl-D-alanine carboxypeptidase family protein [Candidatus Acidoferrum sp.]|nr:D-alanyl-D-alanine carboxypeptidase family protein [Candidatus Acidoferrum sp.]
MKKLFAALLLFAVLVSQAAALSTSARGAALLETGTGTFLYEQDSGLRLPMASTTKIMTAYVAVKYGDITKKFTIPKAAVGVEGSSMYLAEGEVYTLDDLLYGLMMTSGNDAAAAVAICVAGSVADFVYLMNEEAKALGLKDTHFDNPSGLDSATHYTTAAELARLAAKALENADFARYVGTKKYMIEATDTHPARYFASKNRILLTYEGAIGVKTGYTVHSGRSLVTAAQRNGVRLVAVTIDDGNDWNDHRAMLDYGFAHTGRVDPMDCLAREYVVPVAGGGTVRVRPDTMPEMTLIDMPGPVLRAKVFLPRFLYPDISLMQQVGEARIYANDVLICTVPLRSYDSVLGPKPKKSLFQLICGLS